MRHTVYEQSDKYPIALLVKGPAFNDIEIKNVYINYLTNRGIPVGDLISVALPYNDAGKAPTGFIKENLSNIVSELASIGTKIIYCADANYFKVLANVRKAEPNLGYVLDCAIEGGEGMKVVLGVNHKSLIYNPNNEQKLDLSMMCLSSAIQHDTALFQESILKDARYLYTPEEIKEGLLDALQRPGLAVDIETASLRFEKAGIATIALSWDDSSGIAFPVDYKPFEEPVDGLYGEMAENQPIRLLLREFFEAYTGKMTFHNSPFDTKVLIYNLWMKGFHDTEGLLAGLHTMFRNVDDTKIIAYLALNSTADIDLSLKGLAHEYAGNWAQDDIKNVLKIPLPELLEYNLVDAACTNWVREKYYPQMVEDQQEQLYKELMLPSQKVITQVELTGMPLNPQRVQEAKTQLQDIVQDNENTVRSLPVIASVEALLTERAWKADFEGRKAKAKNPDKIKPKDPATFPTKVFNLGSGKQLQTLLYEVLELPIIEKTPKGQPATGGDVLEALENHTQDPTIKKLLRALVSWAEAQKILSTFISAFEEAIDKGDGMHWLHGSFNLGGTVSGRLSSSKPNLQNLPSGSTYGKLIKSCFQAPDDWLFSGADFNSLEDYISALTTKDPNKLKVYLEGYDGHCLRAYSYWPEQFPQIQPTPQSVNTIKKTNDALRSRSKGPTFALTYQGTKFTLMKKFGFSKEEAAKIERSYHELYQVSDQWVQDRLDQAAIDGYVTCAFGLRVRTPLLAQALRKHSSTPPAAEAEGRTAGNALGQSWGLLTNRALNAFMEKVWASPYKLDIRPVAMIHDAIYLLIRDRPAIVKWVNDTLIQEMQWQEAPEIAHDKVKIGAELDVFYPSWAESMTIPNYSTESVILKLADSHLETLK